MSDQEKKINGDPDYQAAEDAHRDSGWSLKAREDAYERGEITFEEYKHWRFD